MNKQQAQQLIKETFENAFDKNRFIGFVKNFLNHMEEAIFTYQGKYIPDAFKSYIKTLERIGKFNDGENNIDILMITLQKETSIDRARTMQRNCVAWYLNGSRGGELKDAALVAFISPNETDWRFSLVKMDYKFEQTKTGKIKAKEEFTPARRWSFLVGTNEKSHTAQSRLINILINDEQAPTLKEIENAFDIETVTKEFFLKYRELFLRTKEELDKVVHNDSKVDADFKAKGVDTVNFAKKLLGQIIFLYFLQKKGWFGVDRNANWGNGSKFFLRELFHKKHANYSNFFNDILELLFYEALRIDRSPENDYYQRFNCKIPFLNGGLFDPIGNYDWRDTDICLSDELFSNTNKTKEGDNGDGIFDIFDRYNFTVKEDEPLEKEVAIDPELLGKAYEKFNAIRPDNYEEFKATLKSGRTGEENKFNKKFGVYYTPREIVHYMCQQSLINYLTTIGTNTASPISKEDIEKLIHLGEHVGEHEARIISKGKETQTYSHKIPQSIREHAKLIDDKLADITVCDPAVGSGAFPVGMMNEIVKARTVFSIFIQDKTRTYYEFKRRCIEHSLYGVDIDPGAVEIAKLRLWLSLVVDEEDIKKIKPLPNLDYRIMQGNSLISEFMGIRFDEEKLKSSINDLEIKINELNNELSNIESENANYYKRKKQFDQELLDKKKELCKIISDLKKKRIQLINNSNRDNNFELISKFQKKKNEFLNESNVSNKSKLKEEVDNMLFEIFETRLKIQRTDFFNRLKYIENKYSGVRNEKQRNELVKQDKEKIYKESGFNLEEAEKQMKEFMSGRRIKPFFLWDLYFSEVFHQKGGFDVVIGNPPYVQLQKDNGILANMYKNCGYKTFERMGDIYALFYENGLNLLTNLGHLCFITSNKWMRASYGKSLRKFFNAQNPLLLIDLGPNIFENATVDTNILIIQKQKNQGELNGITLNSEAQHTVLSHFIKKNKNILPKMSEDAWFIGNQAEQNLKEKIERIGKPLKDWDVKIYFGIKTGLNEAFIIDTATKERLCKEDPKSAEILKPILRGRDIKRYGYEWAGLWIIAIFPALNIDIDNYLSIKQFLLEFGKDRLEQVGKKLFNGTTSRKKTGNKWFETQDPIAYYPEFEKEKVVWKRIGSVLRFGFDTDSMYCQDSTCIMTGKQLKYLCAFMNSKLSYQMLYDKAPKTGTGDVIISVQALEPLLIPPITHQNRLIVNKIELLVDEILKAKRQNQNTTQWETEIDARVAHLYELTEEEYAMILSATKTDDPFRVSALNFYRDIAKGILK